VKPVTTANRLEVNYEEVATKQWSNSGPTAQGSALSTASGNILFTFKRVSPNKVVHISGLKIWPAQACRYRGVLEDQGIRDAIGQYRGRGARWTGAWQFKTNEDGAQFKCPGLAIYGMKETWASPLERNDRLACGVGADGFPARPAKSGGFSAPLCCRCKELLCEVTSDAPFVLTYDAYSTPRFQCRKMTLSGSWRQLLDVRGDTATYPLDVGYNPSSPTRTVVHFVSSVSEVVKHGFKYGNLIYSDEQTFGNSFTRSDFWETYKLTQHFQKKNGKRVYQWVWSVKTDGIGETEVLCFTVQTNKKPKCFPGAAKGNKNKNPDKEYQQCYLP